MYSESDWTDSEMHGTETGGYTVLTVAGETVAIPGR